MQLRPYQERVVDELWQWFAEHPDGGDPIVPACVGAGKSLMIAAVAQRANREAPGVRVLVLVHQRELLAQNLDKLIRVWPQADVGVYAASSGRKQLGCQITYATIGSIYKKAHLLGQVDIIMADECHLINPKEIGMWRTFLADLRKYCPHARVIGWTGTPFRGNGVWLTADKDALFTHITKGVTMKELLELQFLSPLTPAATVTRMSTEGVGTSQGDYIVSELANLADKAELVERACDEIVALAAERKRWLVFAVTVDHANNVKNALRERGVAAEVVTGDTPAGLRDHIISSFRRGHVKCLVNVAVLTTGFDVPEVDFIALLRATKSPVLYVQIAGRGMRLANGKTDCLWADFTTTTLVQGPVDDVKGRNPVPKGNAEAPFRLCDACGSRNHASASVCVECGFEFPAPDRIKHTDTASNAVVLSSQMVSKVKLYDITRATYSVHQKWGNPNTMKVEYWVGLKVVAREWVALDHGDHQRARAESWWKKRSLGEGVPYTSEDGVAIASAGGLVTPSRLAVDESGKYPEITRYEYPGVVA